MENIDNIWQVTAATAHPIARELLTMPGFWDWGDEDSPLGNDIGADTFAAYQDFRRSQPVGRVDEFMRQELGALDTGVEGGNVADDLEHSGADGRYAEIIRRNDFAIALAFAQLVLEGRVDPTVKRRAIAALTREATHEILKFRGGGAEGLRRLQLDRLRAVLEALAD